MGPVWGAGGSAGLDLLALHVAMIAVIVAACGLKRGSVLSNVDHGGVLGVVLLGVP
jgi:hypothetical protein